MKTPLRFGSILNIRVHSIWILNNWGIAIHFLTLFLFLSLPTSPSLIPLISLPFALFPSPCSLGWHWKLGLGPTRPKERSFHYGLLWCQIEDKGFWIFFFFFLIGFKIFICFGELWTFELMVWKLEIDDFVLTKRHEFSEIGDK